MQNKEAIILAKTFVEVSEDYFLGWELRQAAGDGLVEPIQWCGK